MVIKNRLFPYPVLCGDTDDYAENTEFAIVPRLEDTVYELVFDYDYVLKCDALETLLRRGEAEYVLHIECSNTAFRIALKSEVPNIHYRLPKARVSGEITLIAMIVAKMDIFQYSSRDLNEDYEGTDLTFKKGSILAYQNLPSIFVTKKTEELAANESFFTVIKEVSLDPNEIKPLSFNLYSHKIQIRVDAKTYEAFIRYRHSKSIAMAMLVLPALAYMVSEAGNNPEPFRQYQWYQRMAKFYRAQGKDFEADILGRDDNPVSIAQEMLQNPVGCAYRELYELEG